MPGLLPPSAAFRALASTARCARPLPSPSRLPAALRMLSTSSSRSRPTFPATATGLGLKASHAAPPGAGTFFAQSYLPFSASARASFFTPSRYASSSAAGAAEPTVEDVRTIPRSLPIWLLGCSALVFGIIVIGGLTRLTESGLSIVEWNPITGIRPPITDAEWDAEWEKYRVSPEGIL